MTAPPLVGCVVWSLQHQFCGVFTREPEGYIPILEPRTAEKMAAVEFTPDMVLKRLMKLKVGKSCGPEDIHPRLLCELVKQQAAPLTKLFNLTKVYRVGASRETGRKQQCPRSSRREPKRWLKMSVSLLGFGIGTMLANFHV